MYKAKRITAPIVVSMLAAIAMSLSGLARAHSVHEKPRDWVFSIGAGVLQYPRHWDATPMATVHCAFWVTVRMI